MESIMYGHLHMPYGKTDIFSIIRSFLQACMHAHGVHLQPRTHLWISEVYRDSIW